jgi:hypothetical protein
VNPAVLNDIISGAADPLEENELIVNGASDDSIG